MAGSEWTVLQNSSRALGPLKVGVNEAGYKFGLGCPVMSFSGAMGPPMVFYEGASEMRQEIWETQTLQMGQWCVRRETPLNYDHRQTVVHASGNVVQCLASGTVPAAVKLINNSFICLLIQDGSFSRFHHSHSAPDQNGKAGGNQAGRQSVALSVWPPLNLATLIPRG